MLKYVVLIFCIIALMCVYVILAVDQSNKCEQENGRWVTIRNAGINNETHKCIK